MIEQASPRSLSGYRTGAAAARLVAVAVADGSARPGPRPAPRPAPRRIAGGLKGLLCDDARSCDPAPACAARAAFAAGDGYLTGQMIDRAI